MIIAGDNSGDVPSGSRNGQPKADVSMENIRTHNCFQSSRTPHTHGLPHFHKLCVNGQTLTRLSTRELEKSVVQVQ